MNDVMSGGLHRVVEGVHDRPRGDPARHARARHRGRHRRPREGDGQARRPDRRGVADRHQRVDAVGRTRPAARCRRRAAHRDRRRRVPPVPRSSFRSRDGGVRAAQHDAQGSRAGRDASRAEAGRQAAGARVLAHLAAARAALRRVLAQGAAVARQAHRRRCRQLSVPRRIDPHASRPGDAGRDAARRRVRARAGVQPDGRRRRAARGRADS